MPYKNLVELPEEVRGSLDLDGQRTFAMSYNMAWERYRILDHQKGKKSRHDLAWEFAWSEIHRLFVKAGSGNWKKREGKEGEDRP